MMSPGGILKTEARLQHYGAVAGAHCAKNPTTSATGLSLLV
jgi:hypothetical protein